jgi:hypothetical protein
LTDIVEKVGGIAGSRPLRITGLPLVREALPEAVDNSKFAARPRRYDAGRLAKG